MIDTVVLTLKQDQFQITDHQRFDPSSYNLYHPPYVKLGKQAIFKCTQNPTKKDFLADGKYRPRLTLIKRRVRNGYEIMLRVEFSCPKLIFGNNFDELSEKDFEQVVQTLKDRLKDMGVHTTLAVLKTANVSAVHYSKNIILTDYSTPKLVIDELKKVDLNMKLDLNQTDYRNAGHSVRYRTNTFELIFYDKLKDLQQAKFSEKRAVEKDNTIQLTF